MTRLRVLRAVERALSALSARGASPPARPLDRRDFLGAGAAGLATTLLAACNSRGPDGSERLLRYAEKKNEAVEEWLIRHTAMDHAGSARIAGARFPSYFISPTVPVWDPAARGPWALAVDGAVRQPLRLTLDDLLRLPQRRQRVNHYCVEGWTAVADWWGVPVEAIARTAGAAREARYVDFQSFDEDYHESWDLESATHPQTIVAYAKDGAYLPPAWGAPARLHSPVKLGYKCVKYLTRIVFMPERNGGYWSDQGYEWFAGT